MSWLDSDKFYKSGDIPKYNVGQKVWLLSQLKYGFNTTLIKTEARKCEVIEVSKKKSGLFFKEFTYTIKDIETNDEYKDVYESELGELKQKLSSSTLEPEEEASGSWFNSSWTYKSRDNALHHVGDTVYVTRQIPKPWLGTGISKTPTKYVVKEVSEIASGGIINKEFQYTIENLETGKIRKNMYESELMSTNIPLGYYKVDSTHMDYERLDAAIPRSLDLNIEDSLYNDNVLELTYDSRTDKVSLWFDPEFKEWNKLTILFAHRLWRRRTDEERLYYFNRYVEPVMREGIDHIEDLWTADSIFTLLARMQAWEQSSEEFQEVHLPTKKIFRLPEPPMSI